MRQQTIDFEAHESTSAEHQSPQEPLESSLPSPTDFIRPDRQITYESSENIYEWPSPDSLHNRDTITVDRVMASHLGRCYRFLIKRDDTVNVFFGASGMQVGTVTGISHKRREVQVTRVPGRKGQWHSLGCIYPAPEPEPKTPEKPTTISAAIDEVNKRNVPDTAFTEADIVHPPYSFDDFKAFLIAKADGNISFAEYQTHFKRLSNSKGEIISELLSRFKATPLKVLASRMGEWRAKTNNKQENADSIYRNMLSAFLLDGTVSFAMGGNFTEAVIQKVGAITEPEWHANARRMADEARAEEKALSNPETLSEYAQFLRQKTIADLTDNQLADYDRQRANQNREQRNSKKSHIVEQVEAGDLEGLEMSIIESFHAKREVPVWIVQLNRRVDKPTYKKLDIAAKQFGGRYSRFRSAEAGFQFFNKESAEKFAQIANGSVDRSDELEARRAYKIENASERLHALATDLQNRAEATLARSEGALQNTERRARLQAGVRGEAYKQLALSRTMHSVGESLSTGEAKYLDGLRHKTHLETLGVLLYFAKNARIRAIRNAASEQDYGFGLNVQHEKEKPYSIEDVRFAKYPYPAIGKHALQNAVLTCRNAKGAKMAATKMAKRVAHADETIEFKETYDIEQLQEFLDRAKGAGHDTEWLSRDLVRYNRLRRAAIDDIHELRAALREYLGHHAQARGDDPVHVAERELIGKKLPGFFPTPRSVGELAVERADIKPGHTVKEPHCGKGDLAILIRELHPDAQLTLMELNLTLQDVLAASGLEVEFGDFLEHQGTYNRIVMNPPFENGQDIDHVLHGYTLLDPADGKLVSVMSEGPFFRQDKKATEFRAWLEAVGGYSEKLPDDSFKGVDAFRQTGVSTRLVVIDKD